MHRGCLSAADDTSDGDDGDDDDDDGDDDDCWFLEDVFVESVCQGRL